MTIEKTNFIDKLEPNIILNIFSNKKMLLAVFLLPILFIVVNNQNFYSANALNSSNNVVDQSQSNSQSNVQSNSQSNSNNGNCTSVQSQTTVNGKTTTTSKNNCGDNTSVSSSSSDNSNLKGPIVSAEYNLKTGVIINSVFGNWSLTTKGDNSKDFKSSFIVKPIYYNNFDKPALKTPNNAVLLQNTNTTSYILSNFIVNSVQQLNLNTIYVGKIDVVQNEHSSDLKRSDETNIFKGKDVSISILGDRVLIINFDKQSTNLFDVFKNIPLVGLVPSNGVK